MVIVKSVVITGSTRGIGFGLADAFLSLGCSVTVSGRFQESVKEAAAKLVARYQPDRVFGHVCDVRHVEQIQSLWDAAREHYGRIDVWINNAGVSHEYVEIWKHSPEQTREVLEVNLLGAVQGSAIAIRGMHQQGFGALYNMEGLGSDGRRVKGVSLYGLTKYGLHYLTQALVDETRNSGIVIGAIRPGMVVTDLLTKPFENRPAEWERAKRIFNILAERVETVTPWIARRVLANTRTGVSIRWLTPVKVLSRLALAPFRKRDVFN